MFLTASSGLGCGGGGAVVVVAEGDETVEAAVVLLGTLFGAVVGGRGLEGKVLAVVPVVATTVVVAVITGSDDLRGTADAAAADATDCVSCLVSADVLLPGAAAEDVAAAAGDGDPAAVDSGFVSASKGEFTGEASAVVERSLEGLAADSSFVTRDSGLVEASCGV
jgi:hypothetical protein